MTSNLKNKSYWFRLIAAGIFSVSIGLTIVVVWQSYQQTLDYLHPKRQTVSGDLLRTNNIEFQEIELITEDNIRLGAWYTPPKNGAIILVAHGYGDKRAEDLHALFVDQGYGVVAWDFRAHGESGGDFSSLGYYEVLDAKAALDFALAQPGVEHIGGWGGSMGAVTMIRATAQYQEIEALVADSPFSTLEDELNLRVPFPIMHSLIRYFAEKETGLSLDLVRPVDDIVHISPRPVFVIQGMGDTMVPLDSAQRIYDAAGEPRQLWTENDVPHLNMYAYYKTRYTKRVIKFFDTYLLER
ncbi:MAG TPA: alpha/beta hydrolase [Anaerolineales bacterium]|nr:alpha/beta hydrolase [Anaerolineales bacterium]